MNIIFGKDDVLESKYTVLELDTMMIAGRQEPITAYCVLENIPITEMANIDQYRDLHESLMKNYRMKNWKFCQDALEHLMGKWNREMDTFYSELSKRVQEYEQQDPGPDWTGVVTKDNK